MDHPNVLANNLLLEAIKKTQTEDYQGAIELCDEVLQTPNPLEKQGVLPRRWMNKLMKIKLQAQIKKDFYGKNQKDYEEARDFMNKQKLADATVFYPGTAFDFGPLSFFAQVEGVEKVVYADLTHWDSEDMWAGVQKHLSDFTITDFEKLRYDDLLVSPFKILGLKSLHRFIKKYMGEMHLLLKEVDVKDLTIDNDFSPGFHFKLSKNGKTTDFTYYFSEGSLVYDAFLNAGLDVKVLVLQNHGSWPRFGGESELYTRLHAKGKLPDFLFVAKDGHTAPWPGYKPTTPSICMTRGQMFRFKKMIYRRVEEDLG